jgi:predicted ATPase
MEPSEPLFSLLGPLEVTSEGRGIRVGGPRHRAALAVLLLQANHVVPTTTLIDELWGDDPPETALNALQGYISDLRKALAVAGPRREPRLETRAPGYVLHVDEGELDLHACEALLAEGRAKLAAGDHAGAAETFEKALALWRGPALAEPVPAGARLLAAERLRLEELRLSALEERIDAVLALGRAPDVVGELQGLVAEHPLRERLWAQLMTALYLSGRQADALDAFLAARRSFRDDLGLEPSVELQRLQQAILRQDSSLDARLRAGSEPSRLELPAAATAIVGREPEIAEISALLESGATRLLTITGPGGVGKTRLALEVADRLAHRFSGGGAFVGLADVHEVSLVPPALCRALAIRIGEHEAPVDTLLRAIAHRSVLLVLDNLEQVVEASDVVARLLAASPGSAAIATSRAPLRIAAEHEFRLGPLPVPPAGHVHVDDVAGIPSVALFVTRAQAVRRGFDLTVDNAAAVAALCSQLEGLPLALELAAARVRLLGPDELLARLESRLTLAADRRDAPARHATLGATLAWSYELLAPTEQRLFEQLSVFAGGFTLAAAERVCLEDAAPVDAGLEALVASSMVETVDAPELRLRMLETIREYGAQRLEGSDAAAEVRRRHLAYFLAFAEEGEQALTGPAQRESLAGLERERENLRAAFEFAVAEGDGERALRLACALRRFLRLQGHLEEGRRILDTALVVAPRGERALRAAAYNGLGTLAGEQGDFEAAHEALTKALELAPEDASPALNAAILANLGNLALFAEDLVAARSHYERALAIWRRLGDTRAASTALENLGCVALAENRLDDAAALLAEGEELARASRSEPNIAATLAARARLLVVRGELDEAEQLQRESLDLACALGEDHALADSLDALAGAAAARGELERAAVLAGAADATWSRIGARRPPDQDAWRERALASMQAALTPAELAELYTVGAALARDAAVEYARQGSALAPIA